MELFLLYLWLKIDSLRTVLGFGFWIPFAVVSFAAFPMADGMDHDKELWQKYVRVWKRTLIISIITLFTWAGLPSKTDIAILVGASVALDMAKSPEGVKVGTLLRGKVNEVLDEAIKEMTPKPAPAK